MKPVTFNLKSFAFIIFFSLVQLTLLAQENATSSTSSSSKTEIKVTDSTDANWYASPWVWIIGAAIFILLLVALLSNRGSDRTSDRVVVKKTVVDRDRDVDVV